MELLSKKSAPVFLGILLVLKLLVSGLNAHLMPERQNYDPKHHAWRVRTAGLEMDKMAYNGPIYYLTAYPGVKSKKGYGVGATRADAGGPAKKKVDALIKRVRYVNVAYLGAFYALWVFYLFRRLLPDWRSATLAGTMLLALPGYQKMAALVHPDNLLTLLATVSFAGWVALESSRRKGFWGALGVAIVAGLTGLTRPFAAVPVLVHALLNVHTSFVAAGRRLWSPRFLGRAVLLTALTGTMAVSWFAYRYKETGQVTNAYRASYMEQFIPLREAFDYRSYYTSFHLSKLLETPNRTMAGTVTDDPNLGPYGNSFPTILYSEIWGDHWLYFSGRQDQEGKLWPKRLLFVIALPLSLFVALGLLANLVGIPWRALRQRRLVTPQTAVVALALLGIALFLYWQGGAALLPGKNSTIKFVYVAYLVPFVLAVAFSFAPSRRLYNALLALAIATYVAAFPVATFNPPPEAPAKPAKAATTDADDEG